MTNVESRMLNGRNGEKERRRRFLRRVVLRLAVGSEFKIGDQKQINDVHGFVGLQDDQESSARHRSDEVGMVDRNGAPIRQVHDKRTERLGVQEFSHLFSRHASPYTINAGWGQARRSSGGFAFPPRRVLEGLRREETERGWKIEDGGWRNAECRMTNGDSGVAKRGGGLSRSRLRRFAVGADFQVGHQAQVHDVVGVVQLINDHGAAVGSIGNIIGMVDRNLPSIRQMKNERVKGLFVALGTKLGDGHDAISLPQHSRRSKPISGRTTTRRKGKASESVFSHQ